MESDESLIPMTIIELRASLLLMSAFTAVFVTKLGEGMSEHKDPTSARKAIEAEAEKIIQIALDKRKAE